MCLQINQNSPFFHHLYFTEGSGPEIHDIHLEDPDPELWLLEYLLSGWNLAAAVVVLIVQQVHNLHVVVDSFIVRITFRQFIHSFSKKNFSDTSNKSISMFLAMFRVEEIFTQHIHK